MSLDSRANISMTKEEMTSMFLTESNIESSTTTLRLYVWKIWQNPLSKTSYRLTKEGYNFLSTIVQLKHYPLELKSNIMLTGRTLLALDKHLTTPFYLDGSKKIIFFGEKDAIMVTLTGCNLMQYLENFSK